MEPRTRSKLPDSVAWFFLLLFCGTPSPIAGGEENGDAARERNLQQIRVYVDGLEKPRDIYSESGLQLKASLIPDALAYLVGREYLSRLDSGKDGSGALEETAKKFRKWKRYRNRALLKLTVENPQYSLSDKSRRLYTIQKKIPDEILTLRAGTRSERKLAVLLAEKPKNLRLAEVRIQKFWKLARGRRVRLRDPNVGGSPAWEPKLSKPMRAFLVEKEPVEFRLFCPSKPLAKSGDLELTLVHLKKYEGPFVNDRLDLNEGRRWDPIPAIRMKVGLPPEGLSIPGPLEDLLERVKKGNRPKPSDEGE